MQRLQSGTSVQIDVLEWRMNRLRLFDIALNVLKVQRQQHWSS